MVQLPDGEKFLKICLFALTEYTNVTDRWTDTAQQRRPHLWCLASCSKNQWCSWVHSVRIHRFQCSSPSSADIQHSHSRYYHQTEQAVYTTQTHVNHSL